MWEHPTNMCAAQCRTPAQLLHRRPWLTDCEHHVRLTALLGGPTRETKAAGHAYRLCQPTKGRVGWPQHGAPHQNYTRPASVLSTPSPRTGSARYSQSRVRRHAEGRHSPTLGWSLVVSTSPRPEEGQRLAPVWGLQGS
jgi:hypothetical protein